MPNRHVAAIMLTLLFAAVSSATFGSTLYKWRDAAGAVHYTDTPPPAGARLLPAPKSATLEAQAVRDKPMLRVKCRPDISATDCAAARKALQADLEDLARTSDQVERETPSISRAEIDQRRAVMELDDCKLQRRVLVLLERRQSGDDKGGDRLTAAERAAVPAQIAEAKAAISRVCH